MIPPASLSRVVPHRTIAGVVFVAFALGFAVVQISWLQELRRPRVVLLGAGDRLSVLVTAGDARLLLASGDDPAAFGNALGRVLRPSQERIDEVLVAGEGDDLRAAALAAALPGTRSVVAVAPFPRSPDLPSLIGVPVIGAPRRIDLGTVAVTVEAVPANDGTDEGTAGGATEGTAWAWRATIERGASTVVVLSDGGAAARFPPSAPGSVLVVSGEDPMAGWEIGPAPVLALPDAAIPPERLRETAAAGEPVPSSVVRVFPGEAVALEFVAGGIALPRESTVLLEPNAAGSPGTTTSTP